MPTDRYDKLIDTEADRLGIDRRVAHSLFEQESSKNPDAVGDGGRAIGLGQLHEGAAKDMGLDPADRRNPALNIKASLGYLAARLGESDGDYHMALAGYNQGPRQYNDNGRNYANNVLTKANARTGGGAAPAKEGMSLEDALDQAYPAAGSAGLSLEEALDQAYPQAAPQQAVPAPSPAPEQAPAAPEMAALAGNVGGAVTQGQLANLQGAQQMGQAALGVGNAITQGYAKAGEAVAGAINRPKEAIDWLNRGMAKLAATPVAKALGVQPLVAKGDASGARNFAERVLAERGGVRDPNMDVQVGPTPLGGPATPMLGAARAPKVAPEAPEPPVHHSAAQPRDAGGRFTLEAPAEKPRVRVVAPSAPMEKPRVRVVAPSAPVEPAAPPPSPVKMQADPGEMTRPKAIGSKGLHAALWGTGHGHASVAIKLVDLLRGAK